MFPQALVQHLSLQLLMNGDRSAESPHTVMVSKMLQHGAFSLSASFSSMMILLFEETHLSVCAPIALSAGETENNLI